MTELEVIGSQISYADLRFLYFIPADCKSAGTIANVVRLTKVKSEERRVKNPIALLVCFTRTTFACDSNS